MNGLTKLMPKHFHSKGKYMSVLERYHKRSNHQAALLIEVELAVARVEDLNPLRVPNLRRKQNHQKRKKLKIKPKKQN